MALGGSNNATRRSRVIFMRSGWTGPLRSLLNPRRLSVVQLAGLRDSG